jgi:hypothetical protein
MKLLFLDIDGVLNNYRSELVFGREKSVDTLDPVALKLVQKVVKETGCVICLSSNWRFTHDFMELGAHLDLPILFQTPDYGGNDRGEEIMEVVNGLKPDKFVILDDDEEDHEYEGMQFVNVAEEDGLSYKDYLLLIEYLK